ncbi:MAG: gliding motility protein GldL [Bacteroidetes bacterium]|nr:gliding motility protein GldL [Bacteroidota bacterium]
MSGKGNWLGSKKGKTVMKHFFGWGAAIVIVGALFKIQHYPGSDIMLPIGLGLEALIFVVMIFVPDHAEYDWERVHPILDPDLTLEQLHEMSGGGSNADLVAKQLEDAGIDDELLSKLKDGMSNLASNAASLGAVSTAAGATDSYVKSLESASQNLNDLTKQYAQSAEAIAGITGGVQGNFGAEMQKLGDNLSALNNVYELQLKSNQDYLTSLNSMGSLQESIKNIMTDLASSAKDTQVYRENMALLSQNLTDLNNVYGNMLRAMKG